MIYKLSKGDVLVDEEDVSKLLDKVPTIDSYGYPVIGIWDRVNKNTRTKRLHVLIMAPSKGVYVDHINGDKLDNRRSNLRVCTNQENGLNRTRLNKNNRSGERGIYWDRTNKCWSVQVKVNYKAKRIGRYKNFDDAVRARDDALMKIIENVVK